MDNTTNTTPVTLESIAQNLKPIDYRVYASGDVSKDKV